MTKLIVSFRHFLRHILLNEQFLTVNDCVLTISAFSVFFENTKYSKKSFVFEHSFASLTVKFHAGSVERFSNFKS